MSKFSSTLRRVLLGTPAPGARSARNSPNPGAGPAEVHEFPSRGHKASGPAAPSPLPPARPAPATRPTHTARSKMQPTESAARRRAMIIIIASLVFLVAASVGVLVMIGSDAARGVLGSPLAALETVILLVILVNVMILSYVAHQALAVVSRRPALVVQLRNPHADGRPVVYARRENVIEILVANNGNATAKHITAAFRWAGGVQASMRGPGGVYLDRRFWIEGDGRIRIFNGGLEKVLLPGRNNSIAEFHISRPEGPVKLAYKIVCEDMHEAQGEIELPLREID